MAADRIRILCFWVGLDMFSGGFAKNHILAEEVAIALEKIDVAESLPFLERAACQGVSRAIEAVGAIGNTESFEVMLEAAKRDPQRCAYMDHGFYWLVQRSNKKTEEWSELIYERTCHVPSSRSDGPGVAVDFNPRTVFPPSTSASRSDA
jgi:hypothetical protein